jgi:predicted TIM-barrel fold metal-dependent hydrolase
MIIDSNMHWLPENLFDDEALLESFLNVVPRQYGIHASLAPIPGKNLRQIVIEQPKGCEILNYAENQYSSAEQIKDMNGAGIDIGMLRIPCWQEWLDLETCKKLNDGLANHLKTNPGRFLALAVVPPWGTKGSLKEMERCIKELGFSGVQMAAHYGNLYLDEEEFKPHFKKINELNIPVVVHHTPLPVDFMSICKYTNLRRQYGRCVAQATAVGRELFSGMFDEFPNLKMIHSMLGGGFFAYSNMLAPKITGKDAVQRFQTGGEKINQYLENNIYFDTSGSIQWGKTQLECAVKVLGADHILYGSSYPIRRDWFTQGVAFVKNLDIDDESKSLILSKNAIRIFNIKQ